MGQEAAYPSDEVSESEWPFQNWELTMETVAKGLGRCYVVRCREQL